MSKFPESIVAFAEREGHMHRKTHVVLTSGYHSDTYGNYRFLGTKEYQAACEFYVRLLRDRVCEQIVRKADDIFWVGPRTMGAVMVQCLAQVSADDHGQAVSFLALKKDGPAAFHYPDNIDQLNPERKPVVFVDDVLTGGTTVGKAKPITDLLGGVRAVAVWMDRSRLGPEELGVNQIIPLECIEAKVWTPDKAWAPGGPCAAGKPVRFDLGKPGQFLAEHPNYPTCRG